MNIAHDAHVCIGRPVGARAKALPLTTAPTSGTSDDACHIGCPGAACHQRSGNLQGLQQLQAAFEVLQPFTSAGADGVCLLHRNPGVNSCYGMTTLHHELSVAAETVRLVTACVAAHLASGLLVVTDLAAPMQRIQCLALRSHGGDPGQLAVVQRPQRRQLLRRKVQCHLQRGIQAFHRRADTTVYRLQASVLDARGRRTLGTPVYKRRSSVNAGFMHMCITRWRITRARCQTSSGGWPWVPILVSCTACRISRTAAGARCLMSALQNCSQGTLFVVTVHRPGWCGQPWHAPRQLHSWLLLT